MKKSKLLAILCLLTLVSCGKNKNSSVPGSVNAPTSNDISSLPNTSVTPENDIVVTDTFQERHSEIVFTTVIDEFDSSYRDKTVVALETNYLGYGNADEDFIDNIDVLTSFNNTSHQSSTISNVPVLNAYDNKGNNPKYVTLLSDATFDITHAQICITIWSKTDFNNAGDDYYLGLEYYKNNEWKRLNSVELSDVTIGALKSEDDYFDFDIPESGVRQLRIAFDFPNAQDKVRFGVYALGYFGKEYVVQNNSTINNITINSENTTLKVNEELLLDLSVNNNAPRQVGFKSNNRAVVIVNECGLVKAIGEGSGTITCFNGSISDTITIQVMSSDVDANGIIQSKVSFVGEIPDGFVDEFVDGATFFGTSGELNFKNESDAILTPVYKNIDGQTIVMLNMRLSADSDKDLSSQNKFAVAGLDENGNVLETVSKTNLINLNLENIEFEFSNPNIKRYRIYFEYKHMVDYGTYYKTGKNYCLNNLSIYKK